MTDSNIWRANGSDVRRRPQNLTTQLSAVLGFIARIGERTGLTCFTFWLDIVLRYSVLRAIETYHTSIELIGPFPQSTSLAKINRWMLKLAVFRRSNLPIEGLPEAQKMPRDWEKSANPTQIVQQLRHSHDPAL